jgi:hypothetical protein
VLAYLRYDKSLLRVSRLACKIRALNEPMNIIPMLIKDFKFAKRRSMVNSIDNVYDFCKVMITLVSGFVAAYFALLKFLGVENALQQSVIPSFILLYPPILFVISIMVLVFGAKPHIFFGDSFDIEHLKQFRNNLFYWKYIPMLGGMGLFLIGLILTMYISMQILQSSPSG